ncbi:hypothetical protein MEQU1_003043 [Malassezia equina]|uniref:Vacuolar cation-chloride cotransporter 1 n=1 Tax=Malassezia equina TaxID=1381935 RepID=A0AAF0EG52_9BASI|nr:hypothetical protein MEQU1_003043 [Malassezia equina]
MSRFLSADEADYQALRDKLLRRVSVQETVAGGDADPEVEADSNHRLSAGSTELGLGTASPASGHGAMSSPSLHRRNSDEDQSVPVSPQLRAEASRHSGMPDEAIASAVLHGGRARTPGMLPATESGVRKLGTWDGVFMPVTLNVLGIILFLRFGFILGQAGLFGALLLLIASYAIDTLTVLSLNAISTNGQVRGGGAYYLISRSLGPEFGGSIGLIFFFGQAFNASMNVLGFVESMVGVLGLEKGSVSMLPEGTWFLYLYGSVVLWLCTLVCLFGSSLFTRATLILAFVMSLSVVSIPLSSFLVRPFEDVQHDIYYTGWSLTTLSENLWPRFTSGAAGSSTAPNKESWFSVFGVLFPAVCGILAGASMSGDLRKPSKSIPKGTNWSLVFTFVVYVICFIIMAATIPRESLYMNVGIVSDVARWPIVIVSGELASCAFSALMGVMACAKVLQAIARDDLLPVLLPFAQGTARTDIPTYAVLFTAAFCQLVLLLDSINMIAQLVTMTTLLTFGVLCAATFALKAGGAPSFRPSFRYWNIWTAAAGTVISFSAMLLTDASTACICMAVTAFLFIWIQVVSPPKPWGDVSHNVTYHFVRKYLLRLDERKGHVKYWRPQILLLANHPDREKNLIMFCNSLKKGALYVLGHVLKGDFYECLPELRQSHLAWLKLVDVSRIKSFVDVVIARDEREGARNLILSSGLGGMRPNIIVLGFPSALEDVPLPPVTPPPRELEAVPELSDDAAPGSAPIRTSTYVGILEDALALNKALAVAYNFSRMTLPSQPLGQTHSEQYIDLWPIQIANPTSSAEPTWDTYTMVLQLGTILSFTGTWRHHKLRVSVFVEHPNELASESTRVRTLLDNLRIPASLRVFCLSNGSVPRYDAIVLGKRALDADAADVLRSDPWWLHICERRQAHEAHQAVSQPRTESMDGALRRSQSQDGSVRRRPNSRQFGVSLPDEHLAYHHNNIRLGLAHPRSREDTDDEVDGLWMESDGVFDELEKELASLAVDWDPKYLIRARRRRAEESRQLLGQTSTSSSYGSLSSSQRTLTPAMVQSIADTSEDRTQPPSPQRSPRLSMVPLTEGRSRPVVRRPRERAPQLSFNDLPDRAQYLILNELIRLNSRSSTSVVLTALPAPAPGTSTTDEESLAYLHQLRQLYGGGPPVLGVHATTLTMTMTL